jgi:hypothetical protein
MATTYYSQRSAESQVLSFDSSDSSAAPASSGNSRPTTSSGRKKTSCGSSSKVSEFRQFLDRDELPLSISAPRFDGSRRVAWKTGSTDPSDALAHWLPLCLGGLQDATEPYPSFAFDASMALLERALAESKPVKAALPPVMAQLKAALGTREAAVVHRALLVLQQLAVCDGVGAALSDYYRALLPLCNILQDAHLGTGDERTRALVADALETLEAYGPPDAHVLIQQYVPAYQRSC